MNPLNILRVLLDEGAVECVLVFGRKIPARPIPGGNSEPTQGRMRNLKKEKVELRGLDLSRRSVDVHRRNRASTNEHGLCSVAQGSRGSAQCSPLCSPLRRTGELFTPLCVRSFYSWRW